MRQFGLVAAMVLLLVGCVRPVPRAVEQPPPAETIEADSEAARVLLRFADLVTQGELEAAADLLAPGLRGVYQSDNFAPMRNTPRMEVISLAERTGEPNWRPDVGARDQQVAEFHVFAFDVRYHVLGLIDSYFPDGEIYHHKATVTKYTPDRPWLISELSGFGNRR